MYNEDEALEISRKQSITAKNERLAKEKNMIRVLTPIEEEILRKGLQESELKGVID